MSMLHQMKRFLKALVVDANFPGPEQIHLDKVGPDVYEVFELLTIQLVREQW